MPRPEHGPNIWSRVRLLAERFLDDRCLMYASALSFSSMLSIVPFLAIIFAVLKALNVHNVLAPIILTNVAAGSHEIINRTVGAVTGVLNTTSVWVTGAKVAGKYILERYLKKRGGK